MNKQQVMKIAHEFRRNGMSMREALKRAWHNINRSHTPSSIRSFKRCKRYYNFKYNMLLDTSKYPLRQIGADTSPLMQGRCIHEMIEMIHLNGIENGLFTKNEYDPLLVAKAQALMIARDKLQAEHGAPTPRVLWVEKVLTGKLNQYKLTGQADGLVEFDGGLWLMDHKTSAWSMDREDFMMLDQPVLYYHMARRSLYEYYKGKDNLRGLLIHYIRVPSHRLLKSDDDNYAKYRDRMVTDIIRAHVNPKGADKPFFAFYELTWSEFELNRRLSAINHQIGEMVSEIQFIHNENACKMGGRRCEFWDICVGWLSASQCGKREYEHEELRR